MKDIVRVKEVAEMIGVSKVTILRWMRQGHGPAYLATPSRKLFLFKREDVLQWILSMKGKQGGMQD